MATASGTVTSQNHYNDGWVGYGTAGGYAGANSTDYFVHLLKFKTPTFSGVSSKIAIKFNLIINIYEAVNLNYALCTSDGNKNKYVSTIGDVIDSYQVESGEWTVSGLNVNGVDKTLTISTDALNSNTTYYLYVWGADRQSLVEFNTSDNHSVTLTYGAVTTTKGVYLYDGSSFSKYEVYIHNGTTWERYIPYIYENGAWKAYGE